MFVFVDFVSQLRCHRQKVELSRIFHLCRGGQFYWQRTPQYIEKTTNLPEVTDELYHIMLYTSPWAGFVLTTLVVICTDCTGSCKSNNHMITTMTTTYILHANIKLHNTEMNMICIYSTRNIKIQQWRKPACWLQLNWSHICIANVGFDLTISVSTTMKNI